MPLSREQRMRFNALFWDVRIGSILIPPPDGVRFADWRMTTEPIIGSSDAYHLTVSGGGGTLTTSHVLFSGYPHARVHGRDNWCFLSMTNREVAEWRMFGTCPNGVSHIKDAMFAEWVEYGDAFQ